MYTYPSVFTDLDHIGLKPTLSLVLRNFSLDHCFSIALSNRPRPICYSMFPYITATVLFSISWVWHKVLPLYPYQDYSLTESVYYDSHILCAFTIVYLRIDAGTSVVYFTSWFAKSSAWVSLPLQSLGI